VDHPETQIGKRSNIMTIKKGTARRLACISFLFFSGAMSVGCGSGEDAHDRLGENQAAALGTWFYSWGTTHGAPVDLGTATNRTCFLGGVAGDLASGSWDLKSSGAPSKARVYQSGGNWWLEARSGKDKDGSDVDTEVVAQAACINSAANRFEATWSNPQASIPLQPVTSSRRCLLEGIEAAERALFSPAHWVQTFIADYNGTPYWWLGGHVGPYDAMVSATAVCVDLPSDTYASGGSTTGTGGGSLLDAGAEEQPLGPYTESSAAFFWAPSGKGVCGLNGFGGDFTHSDWTDGVLVTPPSSFPGLFSLSVTSGKRAWYTCFYDR
jgi:hypothetical protein